MRGYRLRAGKPIGTIHGPADKHSGTDHLTQHSGAECEEDIIVSVLILRQ